jgi:hypothetical protein
MHTGTTIAVVIVALIIIAVGVWAFMSTRTRRLQSRFGPEYQREVAEHGNRWRAENTLTARERRVARLRIQPLNRSDAERFAAAWRRIQMRFVDDPVAAVGAADDLLTNVMQAKGYPARGADFEQRAEDLSVDHGPFIDDYRAADEVARRHRAGNATTEDLRRAMVYYRALFDDLLEVREPRDERTTA